MFETIFPSGLSTRSHTENVVGSLKVAENVVFTDQKILENRPPLSFFPVSLPLRPDERALHVYTESGIYWLVTDQNRVLINQTEVQTELDLKSCVFHFSKEKLYVFTASESFIVTREGVRRAGLPRAHEPVISVNSKFDLGLKPNYSRSYVVVVGRYENGIEYEGPPSSPITVVNKEDEPKSYNISVLANFEDWEVDFVRVYRSTDFEMPEDETDPEILPNYFLVEEKTVAEARLGFTDETPSDSTGRTLYTSIIQQGIEASKFAPGGAKNVAEYEGRLFLAQTNRKRTETLELLDFGDFSLKKVSSENTINIKFVEGGQTTLADNTLSVGFDQGDSRRTIAARLAKAVSEKLDIRFYFIGDANNRRFLVEANEAITVSGERNVVIGTVLETGQEEKAKNLLSFTENDFEAFRLISTIAVGSKNYKILSIRDSGSSLLIFKQDGLFRLYGNNPSNFALEKIDTPAPIINSNCVTRCLGFVYCVTNDGVQIARESGFIPISEDVKELRRFSDKTQKNGFLASSEGRREVYFCTGEETYVFNTINRFWTKWNIAPINIFGNHSITFFSVSSGLRVVDDKDLSRLDYVGIVDIKEQEGSLVATPKPEAGWFIGESTDEVVLITRSEEAIETRKPVLPGKYKLYSPIDIKIRFNSYFPVSKTIGKQFTRLHFSFDRNHTDYFNISFLTDRAREASIVPPRYTPKIKSKKSSKTRTIIGWSGPWGGFPWGGIDFIAPIEEEPEPEEIVEPIEEPEPEEETEVVEAIGWGGPWGAMPWGGGGKPIDPVDPVDPIDPIDPIFEYPDLLANRIARLDFITPLECQRGFEIEIEISSKNVYSQFSLSSFEIEYRSYKQRVLSRESTNSQG